MEELLNFFRRPSSIGNSRVVKCSLAELVHLHQTVARIYLPMAIPYYDPLHVSTV